MDRLADPETEAERRERESLIVQRREAREFRGETEPYRRLPEPYTKPRLPATRLPSFHLGTSEALGADPDFESGKGWDHFKERVLKANPGRVETNRQDQQLDKRKFAGDKMTHSQRSADKKQRRDGAAAGPSQTSPETEGFRTAARQNYHLKHNKCFKCGKTGEAGKRCTRAGLYTWSPPSDFSYGRHLWQGYDQELSIH
ncbi:hypothetical protein WJX84_008468 [Apatococcus fuscideae]|uniref:CCHC-type domain-containing protein n=1 Tax=Apatococcus fuscideae TaxID=2026836 RepID=A0AAW1SCF9_9CHLO